MARGGGGQAGLYDLREDIQRRDDDERRFDDREDDFRRDQAFERAREQDLRDMEQDRRILEQDNAMVALLMDIINDPGVMMNTNGELTTVRAGTKTSSRRARPITGRQQIRRSGQFSRANILPNISKPRKKNKKHCKNLSQCFRQANAKLRLKNGKLRKGKTQSDVAKMAHRLLKKMK